MFGILTFVENIALDFLVPIDENVNGEIRYYACCFFFAVTVECHSYFLRFSNDKIVSEIVCS
jgi:hypothetical protein